MDNDMKLDLRKDVGKYETNPFVLQLKGHMFLQPRANTIVAKGQEIVNTATGEIVQDNVLLGRRKVVDKTQFAKVYADGVRMLLDLSKPAVNVITYIMEKMDFDNKVFINTEKDYQKIGYKSSLSVVKGLKELIKSGVLAPAIIPTCYWVNPMYICKGERFGIYTEVVTQEQHNRDLQKRAIIDKALSKQGQDFFDTMDNATDGKLSAMNHAEQESFERVPNPQPKLRKVGSEDIFTGEFIPLEENEED